MSVVGCRRSASVSAGGLSSGPRETAFIDTLEARTFGYFWELSDPRTGLTPDRFPTKSFVSVSATGFALTAYPIGVERGYITREAARRRVLDTLRFFWTAPQDTSVAGATGYKGFYYHFLDPVTGLRFRDVELSTQDTALLLAGVLFCQSYFGRAQAQEDSIRALADSLYARADWQWAQVRPPTIGHGWVPESGFLPYDWRGYNEVMILYILALGSPTHPVDAAAWDAWLAGYTWGTFYGQEHLGFAALFGHQYTHVWIDFRGIRDAAMRERGIDYFENSRRAVLSQQAYAVANPAGWVGLRPAVLGPDRVRRSSGGPPGDRRARAPVPHLLGPRRLVHLDQRRRHGVAVRRRGLHRLRARDRDPHPDGDAGDLRRASLLDLRIPRRGQPDDHDRRSPRNTAAWNPEWGGSTPTTSASIRARSWP